MDEPTSDQSRKSLSMAEYASHLARNGTRNLPGAPGTFWVKYETYAMMRFPTFHLAPPSPGEIRRVLWRGPAAIVSYNLEPDDRHPVNAWLYLCANREYALDKLPPPMRRNVRRGLKELRIEPITCDQVLDYGFQAFCDSIRRIGLREETPEQFRRYFTWRAGCPGHVFLGAWKDEKLAGFLSIPKVDDWAEIEGPFSLDALLNLRVNDTLLFYALSRYLSEGLCRVVSYGLSSIQGVSNKAGLHVFKTKVGFEARPVHRAFVLHPLIRPFANRLTLWSVNAMLRFRPRDRRLKKVGGVLACVLGDGRILEMEEENISDE